MKKYIFIAFIMAMIALAGCEGGGKEVPGASPYIGGSQGIFATLEPIGTLENNIPTIFDDETFPIEVTLKNRGEEDVEVGVIKVSLRGIKPNDFEGIVFEKTNSIKLDKISQSNPNGGEETIDFGDAKYKLALSGVNIPLALLVTYSYPYKTHISVPKVCFKEDIKEKGVCEIEGVKEAFSSGGPIKVVSVKESRFGAGMIRLDYEVENVGGGEISKPNEEFDSRHLKASFALDESAEPDKWECSSNDEVKFSEGKAIFWCKLKSPLPAKSLYVKPIDLTISYNYKSTLPQEIKIKSSTS